MEELKGDALKLFEEVLRIEEKYGFTQRLIPIQSGLGKSARPSTTLLVRKAKMKLSRIKMKNFRQFYGHQEITFSDDDEQNVTVVHAENGVGKTTLLNAVLWAMYGKQRLNLSKAIRL